MTTSLPDLRVSSSSFFDYDFTYLTLIHHVLLYIGTNTLTWNLFSGGSEQSDRTHGISHKTLILYSLAFSARMVEYLVPLHDFTYDFGVCSGFTLLYWLATIFWMVYQQERTWGDSRVGLNATLFVTAGLAYSFNYDRVDFTPLLFCWAWSHYLEGVAIIPQLWTMTRLHKEGSRIPTLVWSGVHLTVLARVFQLLNCIYLFFDVDILDHLEIAAASFYLLSYSIFLLTIICQALTRNRKNKDEVNTNMDATDNDDKTKEKSE